MDKEQFVSLILYDTYDKDKEDIANLCIAANKMAVAYSGKCVCEGDFSDFVETIDDMMTNNEISVGEYGLNIEKSVSVEEITNRELYCINKVRATNIQESIEKS